MSAPRAHRPLRTEGRKVWRRVWALQASWIDPAADAEHILVLCESVDERQDLRESVEASGDWRSRNALRALDAQIAAMIAQLGLNPTDRRSLQVERAARGKLAELRAVRSSGA